MSIEKYQLPSGWEWKELGEVASINPKRPTILRPDTALTTFVPMPAVSENGRGIVNAELRPYEQVKKGYTYFAEGDVLFAKISPCMQNGKHAVARQLTDGIGFGSTEFHVVRPIQRVDAEELRAVSEWIQLYFLHPQLLAVATESFSGAVGQQRVPPDFLRAVPIPVPPPHEQLRILARVTSHIGAVDNIHAEADQQFNTAQQLRRTLLLEAFHGIMPLSVSPSRDASPAGWRWEKLTQLAKLESGHTPSRRHPDWWGGSIPWIALPDIRALDGRIAMDTNERTNEEGIANSSARVLPAGTVVLSRTASVGFVTMMGRPMATSQDFVNWVCGPSLHPPFLMYLFQVARKKILELAEGAVHKTVYMPTVRGFEVCVPDIGEQKRISAQLEGALKTANRLESALERQITDVDRLSSALIREAFAGAL